jgi:uncharacterized protein YwqG
VSADGDSGAIEKRQIADFCVGSDGYVAGENAVPTYKDFTSRIRQLAPGDYAEKLIATLERSVRISLRDPNVDVMLGQSRFGGWPDVPAGFEWPTCVALSNPAWWKGYLEDTYGTEPSTYDDIAMQHLRTLHKPIYDKPKPLSLLAQINLAELPPDWELPLPQQGQLLFFCDMGDELVFGSSTEPHDRWRVLYFDVPSNELSEMPSPADDPDVRPAVRALRFKREWTIDEEVRSMGSDEEAAAFVKVREMLVGSWGAAHHRLLGHPQPIQGALGHGAEMTLRQLGFEQVLSETESAEAKRAWRSLLQLDTVDDLGWSWGDVGRMHFAIRDADLKQLRFDEVMAEMQCH